MNSSNRSTLIDDWYGYSRTIARKGKKLLHDILTSWPLSTETLVKQITETLKDYHSLWEVILKLIDGDKSSSDLHFYTDTYIKKSQPSEELLRNSLDGLFNIKAETLGTELSNDVIDMAILHASNYMSIVHYGCHGRPVLLAIIALMHDILNSDRRGISTLAAFPLTRLGTHSLKSYLKILTSQWFIDTAQSNGIGYIKIIVNPTIANNRRASLETLFRFDTVGSTTRLCYRANNNQTLKRALSVTLEYYSFAAQAYLNNDQQLTRLQLFDPVFSPSSALSSNPDKYTEDVLSLFYAYQDISTDVKTESIHISIYTASCTLSISTVAKLFRPAKECTHHYYLWKRNEVVPLPTPLSFPSQIALVCLPPLSDQAMVAYFQHLIRNTDGCVYISCLTGSYVQSLQHLLLSFLSIDEFCHIRPDKLFNSINDQEGTFKHKESKVIIFSSSNDILFYMRKYRMFLPKARSLVLFNGATSEPLLNVLVDSLGFFLKHVTICYNDSSIYSAIKDIFQRFYDSLDIISSQSSLISKKIGHNINCVAERLIGTSMLSREIRKKVILLYEDVELLDTLSLAAAVTRFGPGDGLSMADLNREVAYQCSMPKGYNWKPVEISPEEWLLIVLCISETYFSGVITTTMLCNNVIETYCRHLSNLSACQRQLVIKLLYMTMGTQQEYRCLISDELKDTCTDIGSHPIVKRCYKNFKVSTMMHMRRIVRSIIVKLLIYRVLNPNYKYRIDVEESQNLLKRHFDDSIPLAVEIGSLTLLLAASNIPLYLSVSAAGEWNIPPLSSCLQSFCIAGVSRHTYDMVKFE